MADLNGEIQRRLQERKRQEELATLKAKEEAIKAQKLAALAAEGRAQERERTQKIILAKLRSLEVDKKLEQIRDGVWGGRGRIVSGYGENDHGELFAYISLIFDYPNAERVITSVIGRSNYGGHGGTSMGYWRVGKSSSCLTITALKRGDAFYWGFNETYCDGECYQIPKRSNKQEYDACYDFAIYSAPKYNLDSPNASISIDEELIDYGVNKYNRRHEMPVELEAKGRENIRKHRLSMLLGPSGILRESV